MPTRTNPMVDPGEVLINMAIKIMITLDMIRINPKSA